MYTRQLYLIEKIRKVESTWPAKLLLKVEQALANLDYDEVSGYKKKKKKKKKKKNIEKFSFGNSELTRLKLA